MANYTFFHKVLFLFLFISAFSFLIPQADCQVTDSLFLSEGRGNSAVAVYGDSILFVSGSDSNIVDYLHASTLELTSEECCSDGFTGARVIQDDNFAIFYNLLSVNLGIRNAYIFNRSTSEWTDTNYPNGSFQDIEDGYFHNGIAFFFDEDNEEVVFTYNPLTDAWGETEAPFSKFGFTQIESNNKIYFIGGKTSNSDRTDSVDVFDRLDESWTSFNLSESKNGVTAVAFEDKIVIAGGQSSGVNSDRSVDLVEIIDINDFSIQTLQLSEKTNNMTGVAIGNKVIFAGGNSMNAEIINMDDLTLETIALTTGNDLTSLRSATVGELAVFTAGNSIEGNKLFIYNSTTESWTTTSIGQPRTSISIATMDNQMFLAGGSIENREIYIIENDFVSSQTNLLRNVSYSIFPNPTSDFVSIKIEGHEITKVDIRSIDGALLNSVNSNFDNISISAFSAGVYIATSYVDDLSISSFFIVN